MTPDANDLCVFAVKRGYIESKEIYCNPLYPTYLSLVEKYQHSPYANGILNNHVAVNPKTDCSLLSDSSEVSFVPMANVQEKTNVVSYDMVAYETVKKGFTVFQRGDLIWAKITPCMQNGKSCIVDKMPTEIGFGSTEFHVIRKRNENVYMPFIWAILSSDDVLKAAQATFSGSAGQQRVSASLYGDNVIEKHGINRDRTGDREKTRYLCGKQGIFTRDRALIRPGSIRQLETRASTRSASFFHALGGPGRPYNGGGAAGAYRTHNGAKPLKQGHLRAKRGPLGPSRKSQQQTKRTGFAAHGHSIAETASEGKRASRANGALNRAKINGRGQKQGFGGVDRRRGGVTSCYSRRYDDGGDRAITGGKCGKAILHFPHSRVEL